MYDQDFSEVQYVSTRKHSSVNLETKLKNALEELEISRDMCATLIHERQDSEVEISVIVNKNTALKKELSEMDIALEDMKDQRDRLQKIIDSSEQCRETYISSLNRIS